MSGGGSPPAGGERLYRPFRPRAGRVVPAVLAVVWAVAMVVLALVLPGTGPADLAGFLALAALGVWVLTRFASVTAVPSQQGLVVRNLLRAEPLSWPQVVSVVYGRDSTFAQLDLADGTTMSVLAIQRADGAHAASEAGRLAALVEFHSRPATRADGG